MPVTTPRASLDRLLLPFEGAIRDGVRLVMVSNASYIAYEPSGRPALFSSRIVTDLLRKRLRFDGVIITDSMEAPGARSVNGASIAAIRAGVDVLLYTTSDSSEAAFAHLEQVARDDATFRSRLERAYDRTRRPKQWLSKPR